MPRSRRVCCADAQLATMAHSSEAVNLDMVLECLEQGRVPPAAYEEPGPRPLGHTVHQR